MKTKNLIRLTTAMLALAGCSQNEITEQSPEVNRAVGFNVYTGVQTRGTEMNLDAVKASGFGIMAYLTPNADYATGAAKAEFMNNQEVTWNASANSNNGAWEYTPLKFWPTNIQDRISFFAYAPYANSNGITLNSATASTDPSLEFELATGQKNMVDLVVSNPTETGSNTMNQTSTSNSGTVPFKFKHVLTRVAMKAKTSVDISSNGLTKVYIKSVKLAHSSILAKKATLNMKSLEWGTPATYLDASYELKDATDATAPGVLNLQNTTAFGSYGTGTKTIDISTTADGVDLFPTGEYLFLIPVGNATGTAQEGDVKVVIAYDIVTKASTTSSNVSIASQEKEVKLPQYALKAGTAYLYTFTVSLNEIKVSADVKGWGTVSDETLSPN